VGSRLARQRIQLERRVLHHQGSLGRRGLRGAGRQGGPIDRPWRIRRWRGRTARSRLRPGNPDRFRDPVGGVSSLLRRERGDQNAPTGWTTPNAPRGTAERVRNRLFVVPGQQRIPRSRRVALGAGRRLRALAAAGGGLLDGVEILFDPHLREGSAAVRRRRGRGRGELSASDVGAPPPRWLARRRATSQGGEQKTTTPLAARDGVWRAVSFLVKSSAAGAGGKRPGSRWWSY